MLHDSETAVAVVGGSPAGLNRTMVAADVGARDRVATGAAPPCGYAATRGQAGIDATRRLIAGSGPLVRATSSISRARNQAVSAFLAVLVLREDYSTLPMRWTA